MLMYVLVKFPDFSLSSPEKEKKVVSKNLPAINRKVTDALLGESAFSALIQSIYRVVNSK